MSIAGFTLNGVTFQGGSIIQKQGGGGGGGGGSGTITYAEFNPPIIPGNQLEDATATINGSIGFTINDSGSTGIAVPNLSPSNATFFSTQGTGTFTATFGAGSTHTTASVNIVSTTGGGPGYSGGMVFYIDNTLSYPATFNFPIKIS